MRLQKWNSIWERMMEKVKLLIYVQRSALRNRDDDDDNDNEDDEHD